MAPGPDLFRAALKRKNISQNELERRLGVASGTASRWANGERTPSLAHAVGIERELEVPHDSWLDEGKSDGDGKAA